MGGLGEDGLLGADNCADIAKGVRYLQGLRANDDVSSLVGVQWSGRVGHFEFRALAVGSKDGGDGSAQGVVPFLGAYVAPVSCAQESVVGKGVHLHSTSRAVVCNGWVVDGLQKPTS